MQIRWKYTFGLLALVCVGVWLAVFALSDKNLHLIACDVGQGDAILVTYGDIQILTDGGANNKVLDCLGKHMPFWDREIELVILTHPDKDHFRGLIEVFRRYRVDNFVHNGLESGSQEYQVLKKEVGGGGAKSIVAKEGTALRAGKIRLDIVSPKETNNNGESNDNSLVILLGYRDFEAILTGDVPKEILSGIPVRKPLDYIKISHHGSKTGTDALVLANLMPKLAVISVGKNSYGHPSGEVIKLLNSKGIKILRTDLMGDVEVISDGEKFFVKN
ncbi:MAG: hypothetical protein Q8P91_03040 [bacterium]|nr:hypothetical protein [bacterium]